MIQTDELGEKLEEVSCSYKEIFKHTICRSLVAGFAVFIMSFGAKAAGVFLLTKKDLILFIIICILAALYGLTPLLHFKDKLMFYSHGMRFNNRMVKFTKNTSISWELRWTTIFGNHLLLGFTTDTTGLKGLLDDLFFSTFDVTYLNKPKEKYIKTYMNQ